MNYLITEVPYGRHTHRLGTEPRLTYRMGDSGIIHGYSGNPLPCQPWFSEVEWFRNHFNRHLGVNINSALLNLYEDGRSYISYHSDAETKPPRHMVIALSLGQSRRFYFRRKADKKVIKTTINDGDLMVMYGRCQELWHHSIPKQDTIEGREMTPRLSITFRELV